MNLKYTFLLALVTLNFACGESPEYIRPEEAHERRLKTYKAEVLQKGCLVEVIDGYKEKVDCSGVEQTCVSTSSTILSLNNYRKEMLHETRYQDLNGGNKTMVDAIAMALGLVREMRTKLACKTPEPEINN